MSRFLLLILLLSLAASVLAQSDRNAEAGVSSSRDTKIDINPPKDDAKNHPNSAAAVADAEAKAADDADDSSEVQELHPWNPHKAAKDIEVGDFYFKQQNYVAAVSRYREALFYKPDDAIANFRLAEGLQKMKHPGEAVLHYQAYLKVLPDGPLAKDARKAIEKLDQEKPTQERASTPGKAKP
jgi:tetratricopeptide (TPR) repeat protein